MRPLPTGFVTFMFTDIEDSTRLHRTLDGDYAELIASHHALLTGLIATNRGVIVRSMGDGLFAAFADIDDAIAAAEAIERGVEDATWPGRSQVRVRVGLHAGDATPRGDDYVAIPVHQAARVCSAAHGGQVLLTDEVRRGTTVSAGSIVAHGKFHLKGFDEPVALYELSADGTTGPRPTARPAAAHNVPLLRTSFVGRQHEIASIESLLLDDRAPLVVLTGPGGVGKTRLAFEIVMRRASQFAGGGWTVLMANCVADDVVPKLVQVLGLQEEAGVEPIETVVAALREREVLLLLDNCEHVVDAVAAAVSRVLAQCPSVQLLVTSREPLALSGEIERRLAPLSLAGLDGRPADAVALFVERADVRGLESPADIKAVDAICRAVDGLPLAIEIAAARARDLPLPAVVAGADDLAFFVSPLRDGEERQRSLSEVVEWSYRLLSESGKQALRRLSAFVGPFDVSDAAELLAGIDSTNDVVAELVGKSLLVLERSSDRPLRMLAIIRRFAGDALRRVGEFDLTMERHLAWSVKRCDEFGALFLGANPELADAAIVALFDNFLASFDYAVRTNRAQDALRLALALSEYLVLEGRLEIASRWSTALKALDFSGRDRARLLMLDGVMSYFRGVYNLAGDNALKQLDEALQIAEQLADSDLISEVCTELGAAHWAAGSDLAETYYQRAIGLGSTYTRVRALNGLGGVRVAQTAHEEALGYFRSSVQLAHAAGFVAREVIGQFNAAHSLLALGRYDEARASLESCLEQARRSVRGLVPGICESLAESALATGEHEAAIGWFREGSDIARAMGNTLTADAMLNRLADLSTRA